ncbi:hypothetical protein [Acidipropionibacterium jensenii]|uniref:hypothetical protein n=3 Tax=Acidipropionibacterium jensenii TaxID=1749 RepID=UPI0004243408|nr:hypothetical protein [Acidipropionibacterium jensenii]
MSGSLCLAMLTGPLGASLAMADDPAAGATSSQTSATPSAGGDGSGSAPSAGAGQSAGTTSAPASPADPASPTDSAGSADPTPTGSPSGATDPSGSASIPADSDDPTDDPSDEGLDLPTPTVVASPAEGDAPMTITFTVTGCQTPATGIELAVLGPEADDWDDADVTDFTTASATTTVTARTPGWYSAVAVCVIGDEYHGDESEQADVLAFPTGIGFSRSSWHRNDRITLTSYGFTDGERVTFTVSRAGGGSRSWTTTATATGDARRNVFPDVTLPYLGGGSYTITIKGSTYTRTAGFSWAESDSAGPGGASAPTRPVAPISTVTTSTPQSSGTGGRPGLPSTGA